MKNKLSVYVSSIALIGVMSMPLAGEAQEHGRGNSPEVLKLLKDRRETLRELVSVVDGRFRSGGCTYDAVIRARGQLLDAELELASTHKERIAIHERRVKNSKELEESIKKQWENGAALPEAMLGARAARIAAEIALQRERQQEKR